MRTRVVELLDGLRGAFELDGWAKGQVTTKLLAEVQLEDAPALLRALKLLDEALTTLNSPDSGPELADAFDNAIHAAGALDL